MPYARLFQTIFDETALFGQTYLDVCFTVSVRGEEY